MNFELSHEQHELQRMAARFAGAELRDVAVQIEITREPPNRDIMRRFAELGFLGINLPEEYGGGGMSHLDAVLVLEEIGKVSIAVAFPIFESCFGPARAVANFAPEALRRRILPKVCAGEMIVAVSMSEPNAGSALTDLATRATVRGDRLVVSGQKRWCSGAGHADAYVVYCRMSDAPGAKGIGAVLVEKDSTGLTFGKPEALLGFRGVSSADIYFDDVEVPLDNVIVPAGGFRQLMEAFDLERCGNTTLSLACAQSAFDHVLGYVQERRQFGKPLVDFQAVQLHLAEMKMDLDAARLLLYRAVVNAQSGLPSVGESSIAKCFANEMTRRVTGKALQIMGGYGYSAEYPIEQKMRDAWGWGIAGGAIDIQKVNIASTLAGRRFDQRR
ncbi:acyl-CoA dehydrogenase family protein [Xanthobacter autotrophicus]|uniref:acyl-CoA dehydrogenase family protein n=1 Tax=Xanthobacter autotrophicus TaxID=280 RepID=UPI00372B61D1